MVGRNSRKVNYTEYFGFERNNLFPGCALPQRYVLVIMAFLGIVLAYATRVCFSVAINRVVEITDKLDPEKYTICSAKNRTHVEVLSV